MIIQYYNGNLLNAEQKFIAHGCNARGKMNSGVAKAIRDRWPVVFERYQEWWDESYRVLAVGQNQMVPVKDLFEPDDRVVINMITQANYGRDGNKYVSYDAIHNCFAQLNHCPTIHAGGLAIPKIGAGLGGGDWKAIEAIINSVTPNLDITVYSLE
jgi:O-acetyl-ADP-ribose deacetylase (regulator of RNase III)